MTKVKVEMPIFCGKKKDKDYCMLTIGKYERKSYSQETYIQFIQMSYVDLRLTQGIAIVQHFLTQVTMITLYLDLEILSSRSGPVFSKVKLVLCIERFLFREYGPRC